MLAESSMTPSNWEYPHTPSTCNSLPYTEMTYRGPFLLLIRLEQHMIKQFKAPPQACLAARANGFVRYPVAGGFNQLEPAHTSSSPLFAARRSHSWNQTSNSTESLNST